MTCSMSRKGNCWDNAPMESLFDSLKYERVFHEDYATREEARQDLFEYIEVFSGDFRIFPLFSVHYRFALPHRQLA